MLSDYAFTPWNMSTARCSRGAGLELVNGRVLVEAVGCPGQCAKMSLATLSLPTLLLPNSPERPCDLIAP